MEHVVFFPGPDAAPAFRRFSSLDDAVRFVEHLRNAEGVSEVSVHLLTPVPVAFRPYYKVEVPVAEAMPAVPEQPMPVEHFAVEAPVDAPVEAAPMPVAEMPAEMPVADEAAMDAPADVPAMAEMADVVPASNGKRSLGFFAH